jgi:ABC-type uncharacterized transport system auxiliary subunit
MSPRAFSAGVVAAAAACSVLPKAPPPVDFDLSYQTAAVACAASYPSGVEVWDFTAAAPFDRTNMVVTQGREVRPSPAHRWVDRPGPMVAATLRRDLAAGHLFPLVVSPRDPQPAPLQLTGDVYRFAWERDGGSARASFEADLVLQEKGRVLLHKRYDLSSDPVPSADDSSAFARAMSAVIGRFSVELRQDLCAAQGEH